MSLLGLFNFLICQWFFVRRAQCYDDTTGEYLRSTWLTGIVPLTGWWGPFRYVSPRVAQVTRFLLLLLCEALMVLVPVGLMLSAAVGFAIFVDSRSDGAKILFFAGLALATLLGLTASAVRGLYLWLRSAWRRSRE